MKRKNYTTARKRKIDQIIGFAAFPLVNIVLWLVANSLARRVATASLELSYDEARTYLLLFAWSTNAIVLLLAFVFRPQFGVGYIVSIGVAMCMPLVLGVLFVTACFTTGVLTAGSHDYGRGSGAAALCMFGGLMLVGAVWLSWRAYTWIVRWWRG